MLKSLFSSETYSLNYPRMKIKNYLGPGSFVLLPTTTLRRDRDCLKCSISNSEFPLTHKSTVFMTTS